MNIIQQKAQEAADKYWWNAPTEHTIKGDFLAGFDYARGPESWIKVEEGLPPVHPEGIIASINVQTLDLSTEDMREGYCSRIEEKWFDKNGREILVTHWQPMPQLPNV